MAGWDWDRLGAGRLRGSATALEPVLKYIALVFTFNAHCQCSAGTAGAGPMVAGPEGLAPLYASS